MTATAEPTSTAIVPVVAAAAPPRILSDDSGAGSIAAFSSERHFAAAQRIARALCSSTMVPKDYQGENNMGNCLVAMELSSRVGASVLAVMQNVHIIQGRPSWSSVFLIGSVNSCGRFTALRYEIEGGDDPAAETYRVRAYATEKATGDKLVGEWISWKLVHGEGWSKKQGSKWLTMPGQMFRYRAAAFWTRSYAPELSLGMHAADELEDMSAAEIRATAAVVPPSGADKLRALVSTPALQAGGVVVNDAPVEAPAAHVDVPITLTKIEGEGVITPEMTRVVEAAVETPADEPADAEPAPEPAATIPADIKALQQRRQAGKRLTPNEQERLSSYETISK